MPFAEPAVLLSARAVFGPGGRVGYVVKRPLLSAQRTQVRLRSMSEKCQKPT
jgi:hypothetical protein